MLTPPGGLLLGHQAPEVAGRADVAGRLGFWQQAFGRDAALGPLDPLGHHVAHGVDVLLSALVLELAERLGLDGTFHGLGSGPADGGRSPVAAHIPVGGDHVHPLPR
jgi:hypothetical protein